MSTGRTLPDPGAHGGTVAGEEACEAFREDVEPITHGPESGGERRRALGQVTRTAPQGRSYPYIESIRVCPPGAGLEAWTILPPPT